MQTIAKAFRLTLLPIIWMIDIYESIRDNVGTRSVLFGVHQVFIHPVFVAYAWLKLYGIYPDTCYKSFSLDLPKYWFKLIFCFVVHDWGYYGKSEMDGPEGDTHPIFGAELAHKFLDYEGIFFDSGDYDDSVRRKDRTWYNFCLTHSRFYAKQLNMQPSKLCMADKLAVYYYPIWFYIFLGKLTGEIYEYMESARSAGKHGHMALDTATPREFLISVRQYLHDYAMEYKNGKIDMVTEVFKGQKYLGLSTKTTIDGKDLGPCKVYIGEPIDNSDLNELLKKAIDATKNTDLAPYCTRCASYHITDQPCLMPR